jgi:hypothetical protein
VNFNAHSNLIGRHAFLSASTYSWINYDEEHLDRRFITAMAAQRGTELHELAHNLIRLGIKLPKTRTSLNLYVNDAIGYRMTPEQPLFVSENCFGTADAISFRRNLLRIHDLKTGVNPGSIHQLEVYAAMFCLEYKFNPSDIDIEMRIYQNDEAQIYDTDKNVIFHIIDKIITFDKRINALKAEAIS